MKPEYLPVKPPVCLASFARLQLNEMLNDEVINYFAGKWAEFSRDTPWLDTFFSAMLIKASPLAKDRQVHREKLHRTFRKLQKVCLHSLVSFPHQVELIFEHHRSPICHPSENLYWS